MSSFVKAALGTGACTTRSSTNSCISNNSIFSIQSSLRNRDASSSREGTPYSMWSNQPVANGRQDVEELPDGPFFSRRIMPNLKSDLQESDPLLITHVKEAEYLLSFPVVGEDSADRVEYMKNHLAEMKEGNNVAKSKPVILVISLSGIKVCCSSGESVYMAHALKRISYATCYPDLRQFSFLAREPKAHGLVQYCHTFSTKTPEQATELNSIVANAFMMAYANKRADGEKPALTFHDVIRNQIEARKEQLEEDSKQKQELLTAKLSQISTPLVDQIVQQRKERRLKGHEESDQQRPASDRLKLQSQLSGDGQSAAGISASYSKSALSLNLDSCQDLDQQTLSSITRILEALNSGEARTHGSPVTILKDTIDSHFRNGVNQSFDSLTLFAVDPNPMCMGTSSVICQVTDKVKSQSISNPSNENYNAVSSKSSQKPTSSSPFGRTEMHSHPKSSPSSHDLLRSKMMPVLEQSNSEGISRPTTTEAKANGRICLTEESRNEFGKKAEETNDSLLHEAVWYKPGVPRDIVLDMLTQQEAGSFIIRDSLTHPGCYALSIKLPTHDSCSSTDIAHYLITRTSRGTFKLKGLAKEWNSLTALVIHHTVMKELLPCLLVISNSQKMPT